MTKVKHSYQEMNTLANIKQSFTIQSAIINGVPDLSVWAPIIRLVHPKGAIYVIIHDYVEADGSGSQHDAFLLTPAEITWPGQSNEPIYRSTYFHKSSHDPNIWILMDKYRSHSNLLKTLVTDPSIIVWIYYLLFCP